MNYGAGVLTYIVNGHGYQFDVNFYHQHRHGRGQKT